MKRMVERLVALIVVLLMLAAVVHHWLKSPHLGAPTVKIELANGHGSGVHIGAGNYVTAAHVVKGQSEATVKFSEGRGETVAQVLWLNEDYDIALLHSAHQPAVAAPRINCSSEPKVGEHLTVVGSPLDFDFVTTTGRVAKLAGVSEPWRRVFLSDVAVTKGNSGGPAFNSANELVGIVVGVIGTSFGIGWSQVGLSVIVPSSVFCNLTARA